MPPSSLEAFLHAEHEAWRRRGLEREIVLAQGDPRFDFTSNDYLGLARDPRVIAAAVAAAEAEGSGGRASRLLGGGGSADSLLEEEVAEWLGAEAALLFPTGYQANLGLLAALAGPDDTVFSDELNHASIIDGCRLSQASVEVYPHADVGALSARLDAVDRGGRRWVVTESLFSMDGDRAPLEELQEVCARTGASLFVDEAHAVGLLGRRGGGVCTELKDCGGELLAARTVTGGKALGAAGALVVGSLALRRALVQRARSLVFTTALPPGVGAALRVGVALASEEAERRTAVLSRARGLSQRLGLPPPAGAIVPVVVGSPDRASDAARQLQSQGFDVRAVRPPTVPEGTSRLRIVLHWHNPEEVVDELAKAIVALNLDKPTPSRRSAGTDSTAPMHSTRRGASPVSPSRMVVVTGTDTDVGKTVVSALLARAASKEGPADYWKPVQTGEDSDTETVKRLTEGCPVATEAPLVELPLPASPHEAAAAAGVEIELPQVLTALESRHGRDSRQIVELAGGLLVPYNDHELQVELLVRSKLPCVLVARSGLGTLNHTLLSLEALRRRDVEVLGLFLVGEPHPSNLATLRRLSGVARVTEVPRFDRVDAERLEAWLAGRSWADLVGSEGKLS